MTYPVNNQKFSSFLIYFDSRQINPFHSESCQNREDDEHAKRYGKSKRELFLINFDNFLLWNDPVLLFSQFLIKCCRVEIVNV